MNYANFPLSGKDGEDPGFRRFQADDENEVPFNLSRSRVWIIDDTLSRIEAARTLYFELKCTDKLQSGNWARAEKADSVFRYRRGSLSGPEPDTILGWRHLVQALTAEGVDFFFNRGVFDALYSHDTVQPIVEELYKALLKDRSLNSDRTASAAITGLFCLQAAGAILLPAGWASRHGGIRQVWPGATETLSAILHPDERLFTPTVREQLKGSMAELGGAEAVGGNAKRIRQTYRALKLFLTALPPGYQVGRISGDMFIAAIELMVEMREGVGVAPARDRGISNLRLVWNAVAPYRTTLPSAADETRSIRDFVTSFVSRTGIDADSERRRRQRGHQMRKEGDLRWVIEEAPHLEPIVELGREYIRSGTAYVSATLSRGFEKLFEYLIDRPERISNLSRLGRDDFRAGGQCCIAEGGFPSYIDYIRTAHDVKRNNNRGSNKGARSDNQLNHILNATLNFLEWYRDSKDPDFRVPLYRSDIPGQDRRGWKGGKSTKLPVPIRVLNLCKSILTENGYAWSRTQKEDYVLVTYPDGTTGLEWCPVRAVAMLLLFSLPLRGVSVRRLDSGEGDEFIFDPDTNAWSRNDLPTAEPGRSVGVIHQVLEMGEDGRPLGGFFINSNKTQNAKNKLKWSRGPNKSARGFGYIIPWHNEELFRHLAYCRSWQSRYNPVSEPRGLDTVADHSMRVTKAVAQNLPGFYFLFRDPSAGNEPVSSYKLNQMFYQVLEEAGRRLSEDDGRKISLSDLFTLHSLRVGGITAFMKAGVPLSVLTEFVAGHATVIMNIYYQRHSSPEINRIISEAASTLESGGLVEDDLFNRVSKISEDIAVGEDGTFSAQGLVFRDREALDLLRKCQKGLVLIDLDGCCPAGGTMCDLGGPLSASGEATANLLGQHGCATCRFHVNGEPFLAGMVVKANEAIYRLSGFADAIRTVEGQLAEEQTEGRRGIRRILHGRLDGLNLQADQLMMEWSARAQAILMTTGQMQMLYSGAPGKGNAVLIAKENVIFEQCSRFRLADFLARATDIIQITPSVVEEVKLRRRVVLDQLLDDNGLRPFLFSLPDKVAQKSATKLVDFLVEAIGWDGLEAASEHRRRLTDLGFNPVQLEAMTSICSDDSVNSMPTSGPLEPIG
ncbi:VPA1269 family protein [Azospirillum sp. sgz301742]